MATTTRNRSDAQARDLNRLMAACLRLILEDIRAQYRQVRAEAERLEKTGVAVGHIYKQLDLNRKEVNAKYAPTNTNRRVRRAGV